jgi:hypothetical protein
MATANSGALNSPVTIDDCNTVSSAMPATSIGFMYPVLFMLLLLLCALFQRPL